MFFFTKLSTITLFLFSLMQLSGCMKTPYHTNFTLFFNMWPSSFFYQINDNNYLSLKKDIYCEKSTIHDKSIKRNINILIYLTSGHFFKGKINWEAENKRSFIPKFIKEKNKINYCSSPGEKYKKIVTLKLNNGKSYYSISYNSNE